MAVVARRKTVKNKIAFSVRIPPELKEQLEDIAYDKRESLGMTVESLLIGAVKARETMPDEQAN